jgi:hypothetical protein
MRGLHLPRDVGSGWLSSVVERFLPSPEGTPKGRFYNEDRKPTAMDKVHIIPSVVEVMVMDEASANVDVFILSHPRELARRNMIYEPQFRDCGDTL